jgi:pyrimidine-specific ribonucleoside hydrolase
MNVPVHVIVDGGLDDALALGVLLGLNVPLAQVIATQGSLDLMKTLSVTHRLLVSLGCAAPVRLGAAEGMAAPYPEGRDPFHGADGFGCHASALTSSEAPNVSFGRLDGPVFCSAALTVVALGLEPGHLVSELVWMGGAVGSGGNMTPAAEFNAWMDPLAADQVLTSGVPVRMVPLDVTMQFRWSSRELEYLRDASQAGNLLATALSFVRDRDGVFIPHDAVVAIAMTEPELFDWSAHPVRCETSGSLTTGTTVIDRRPQAEAGHVLVAKSAKVDQVTERILTAIGRLS